jgi:hypothetical protein
MVLARVLMVAACAAAIGLSLSGVDPVLLLREGMVYRGLFDGSRSDHALVDVQAPGNACFEMAHGCACESHEGSRLGKVLVHTASEFLDMGRYLILGALAVGLFNVFLPQDLLLLFQDSIFLAIGGMMLLAVLLSVCSEADAFVAASFSSFPKVAQLSFITVGPMVDLKLIVMYGAVFHGRVALLLAIVPIILTYSLSILLQMVIE